MNNAHNNARHFVTEETQFHLGALVTEQAHPRTVGLSEILQRDTEAGIRSLQDVDRDVARAAAGALMSENFAALVTALQTALLNNRRIFFSGCGATGRLSILLEAAWRRFCERLRDRYPDVYAQAPFGADSIISIMTGGDYALVRSVESFEDYTSFGRRQAMDAGVGADDVFVGISEGGETSSVIGSLHQALDAGAKVFFACNNPVDVLSEHVERSRRTIRNPAVTVLELVSGSMAVAGSTRMQAVTFELLAVGAALELALSGALNKYSTGNQQRNLNIIRRQPSDYASLFNAMLDDLAGPETVSTLGRFINFEQTLYENSGLATYFAQDYLLDIFTDTTECSPTFMLPPFRKCDDAVSPVPWRFVKHPLLSTPAAWRDVLRREPRCLEWNMAAYRALGASPKICDAPPKLDADNLLKYQVGNEPDLSRLRPPWDAAIAVLVGDEINALTSSQNDWRLAFQECAAPFHRKAAVCIGSSAALADSEMNVSNIHCKLPPSPFELWHHLAVKLSFNTVSTATMGRMGRLVGNWMAYVDTSNKKLIDRGTRLVAELCGLDYASACEALHETFAEMTKPSDAERQTVSAVARTIERCGRNNCLRNFAHHRLFAKPYGSTTCQIQEKQG